MLCVRGAGFRACVLLCILEAVNGVLCALEVPNFVCCVLLCILEAVDGGFLLQL